MNIKPNWQSALNKFLKDWRDKDFVKAALLTGSYAVGGYLMLSDNVDWRERGNLIIDGVLVEYFANPVIQITLRKSSSKTKGILQESSQLAKSSLTKQE